MKFVDYPGKSAAAEKGWFLAHKWLLLRRLSQLTFLSVFLIGPLADIWIVKGSLVFSMTLDVLPLADPYVLLQSILAGHSLESKAFTGGLIILLFYFLVGGRVYCSWVCPVNMVTDAAFWLRRRLNIKGGARFSRSTRYWILAMTLIVAASSGAIVWELVNPVSMVHRGLIFGIGLSWMVVLTVFLFDLIISREGWCGHLCPVGAFYSLLGAKSIIRISAAGRDNCDDCMDCFNVCPEKQVISPALKGAEKNIGPIVTSGNCTNCGRCIDVCAKNVFRFSTRFTNKIVKIDSMKEAMK